MKARIGHWQAVALSWGVAVLLVGIGYVVWARLSHETAHWGEVLRAAVIGGGGAVLLMAWRGMRGRLDKEDATDDADQTEDGEE